MPAIGKATAVAGGHEPQVRLLKFAFALGAVVDLLAMAPMLWPPLARLMWGLDDASGAYGFAMGYGAALMLGWTALLAWAWRRPLERRFVAALTVLVIWGFVFTEALAVLGGTLAPARALPTWAMQAALLALFAVAYHDPRWLRSVMSQGGWHVR